ASGIVRARQMLKKKEIDVLVFTSSSTVINLVEALGKDRNLINNALVACIGPVTKATALKTGLKADIVASVHTVPGLAGAIEQYFRKEAQDE
ncbi:uroporphyrinogen-III synthase, partial [Chloroflexota bacterium]